MSDDQDDIDEVAGDDAFAALVAELPDALAEPAVWSEPPPWLGESIVAAIAAERAAQVRDPESQVAPVPARARQARRPRQTRWLGAAAAVAAAVAVGVVATRDGDSESAVSIEGTDLAPNARATATVTEPGAGVAIELVVEDLPPAPPGQYYQGWVRSEDGELVTIGTFHMRDGNATITLWSGVEITEFPILTVTIQDEGAGPESSGDVVLRGSLLPADETAS